MVEKKPLTNRQREVLELIKEKIRETGYPPTIREVGDSLGISEKGAYDHLRALEKKGYIRRESKKTRAIEILGSSDATQSIRMPILNVAAMMKSSSCPPTEGLITVPRSQFGDGEMFAFQVEGENIDDDLIQPGDYVIARRQGSYDADDLVIALATRRKTPRALVMRRAKAKAKRLKVQGKVIGLIRKL